MDVESAAPPTKEKEKHQAPRRYVSAMLQRLLSCTDSSVDSGSVRDQRKGVTTAPHSQNPTSSGKARRPQTSGIRQTKIQTKTRFGRRSVSRCRCGPASPYSFDVHDTPDCTCCVQMQPEPQTPNQVLANRIRPLLRRHPKSTKPKRQRVNAWEVSRRTVKQP